LSVTKFDRFCDMEESVQAIAPVVSCESSCVTIFEPQYFGGLRSPQRPYLFLRGCASRLLSVMESPPREVDFLHRAPICVSLPLSQIYPDVYTNEVVEVGDELNCYNKNFGRRWLFIRFLK
uniref:Agenet-like domain-containing protein n=1 Tax=Angiostrongylus cantonensis TaxID=6313 RepID=A0A0K0DHZ8_ANGCA